MENGPYRLMCLNIWSPDNGTVLEGHETFSKYCIVEKVGHQGAGLRGPPS